MSVDPNARPWLSAYHKQLGGWDKEKGGRLLDGLIWDTIPISPAARSETATATRSRRSSAKWERLPIDRRLADRLAVAAAADGMSRRDFLDRILSDALDQRDDASNSLVQRVKAP